MKGETGSDRTRSSMQQHGKDTGIVVGAAGRTGGSMLPIFVSNAWSRSYPTGLSPTLTRGGTGVASPLAAFHLAALPVRIANRVHLNLRRELRCVHCSRFGVNARVAAVARR